MRRVGLVCLSAGIGLETSPSVKPRQLAEFRTVAFRRLNQGDAAGARALFLFNSELFQNAAQAHVDLGFVSRILGDAESASRAYARAAELAPTDEAMQKALEALSR